MKKKDTGGYALAYVLVIILVLCAVAMSICAVALRNFQSQERSVARTRQLYQAEGEIEKLASVAERLDKLGVTGEYNSVQDAKNAYKSSLEGEWTGEGHTPLVFSGTDDSFKVSVSYGNESVQIDAELQIELAYQEIPHYLNGVVSYYTYQVTKAELEQYNTYTITHLTTEGGEGE